MIFNRLKILNVLQRVVGRTKWRVLLATYGFHFIISWVVLYVCGESFTKDPVKWIYFYSVSNSTIGFGDLSPVTNAGRLIYAIFIAPTGIVLFGAVLAKLGELYLMLKNKFVAGNISVSDLKRHVVILGWIPKRTSTLIELLQVEKQQIVIVSDEEGLEHPLLDSDVLYVNVKSYISQLELDRLGLESCKCVVVNTGDEATNHLVSVAIDHYLGSSNDDTHIVVYSENKEIQSLLEGKSNRIEVINVHQEHLLSRSALYAGSSSCSEALLNPYLSASQFTIQLPEFVGSTTFGELFDNFRNELGVIVIGVSNSSDRLGRNLLLNPPKDQPVGAGDFIHYIATSETNLSESTLEKLICLTK